MRLPLTIITILLFWPSFLYPGTQEFNKVSYEFTQHGTHYTFLGTFFVKSNPTCLIHIFYDFKHLPKILSEVDSFVLLQKGENWYDVAYVYNCLLLKGRIIYRRTLLQEQMKVAFEMLESDQRSAFLPKVVTSTGYYEIRIEKEGCRVIYFEEARIGSTLSNEIFFRMAKNESIKFLQELKKYVQRKCY